MREHEFFCTVDLCVGFRGLTTQHLYRRLQSVNIECFPSHSLLCFAQFKLRFLFHQPQHHGMFINVHRQLSSICLTICSSSDYLRCSSSVLLTIIFGSVAKIGVFSPAVVCLVAGGDTSVRPRLLGRGKYGCCAWKILFVVSGIKCKVVVMIVLEISSSHNLTAGA